MFLLNFFFFNLYGRYKTHTCILIWSPIAGVPKLKRSELVTACEDFSNVIGTSPIGTVYKGTLSNGVEIAVASVTATSTKDWSRNLEVQFRKKVRDKQIL